MKVYIVFWSDSFDDWRMEKVFSSEAKALEYIASHEFNLDFWVEEMNVN